MHRSRVGLLALLAAGCAGTGGGAPPAGDAAQRVTVCDAVWRDATRDREVPVRIRIPAGGGKVPVILFSHGLGGSVDAGTTWAEAWSQNGFAVVHLQHPGSDRSLWEARTGIADRMAALRSGMTAEQLVARAEDVGFVLDELGRRSREGACDLTRIDLQKVGMSGHSFGAHTTQAVAGQRFPGAGGRDLKDPRISAAIAFSPAPPNAPEEVVRAAFASITMPFFSITGTEDEVPALTDVTPEERTLPFRFMPPGQKYLLVLDGADHADFSGSTGADLLPLGHAARRGARGIGRGVNAHVDEVVKAATVAFWKATLLGDTDAQRFLAGGGLRSMLAAGDRYETK
jgi:predicted dienelactone hydrolase